ncbi:cell division protein FtsQ/DivIB [Desulfonema magnum]|uniref:Cell division protein FtsQ domain-containing protein n=1 Tax=Desulfonema magnum TaxID=45655 RepID=A0A975GKR9_9BACT|nr:FtsQ-type POTRA domain-containing protein [Desulfonema magnum]QTA84073.1 Cell division protein FtsQ domain-containing protein [Desulfonema magnum]
MENKRIRKNYHRKKSPSKRRWREEVVVIHSGSVVRRGYTSHLPLVVQEPSQKNPHVTEWVTFCLKTIACITFAGVTGLFLIFLYDFLTQYDYFKADHIVIRGIHRLSEKQVMKQAQIETGINILSVNLSKARKCLLANTWIADTEVRRELPSEIHIKITEHEPLAILDLGRKFIINVYGEIFKEWAESDPGDFPIVEGLGFSDISSPGKPRVAAFGAVMDVLQLGQQPGSIIPNRAVERIKADREMGITLYVRPDDCNFGKIRTIKLGYNNYPGKYDRLEHLLFYLGKKQNFININSIDLNNLNRIVVSECEMRDEKYGIRASGL